MDHVKSIVKGSTIVFVMILVGTLLGYLLRLFIARNLTVADYGLFYGVMAFIGIFAGFRDLGLNAMITKYIPHFRVKDKKNHVKPMLLMIGVIQTIITSVVMLGIFFLSDWIALTVFGTIAASIVLKAIALSTIASIYFHIFQSSFQGLRKIELYSITDVLRVGFIFILTYLFIGNGAQGVSYAYLFGAVGVSLLFSIPFFYFIRKLHADFSFAKEIRGDIRRKMLRFSGPVLIGNFSGLFTSYFGTIAIAYFVNLESVGFYQAALPTSQLLQFFAAAIIAVVAPFFAELWAKGDKETIEKTLGFILLAIFFITLPIIFLAPVVSGDIFILLFGGNYVGAAPMLLVLFAAAFMYSLFSIFNTALQSIGRTDHSMKSLWLMAIITIILTFTLVPVLGGIGAAISLFVAYFVTALFAYKYLRREFSVKLYASKVFGIIASSIIMLIAVVVVKQFVYMENLYLEAVIMTVMALVLYVLLIVVFKVFTKKDVEKMEELLPLSIVNILKKVLRD
ncbi:hypothetical protein CL614_06190 [archaeon]|nr:hypothetical protein [archaeon]|tara:strand:+ start:999 stop:2525 length:1527 start_codon:yes stop_codon:yes gene_type:complete